MIRAWLVDGGAAREAPADEVIARVLAGAGNGWIDFDCEDEASARAVLEPLHIHPLVLEDMVSEINRPKVDNYGDYLYLVVHSARWEAERPMLREVDIVVGEHWLVTYHEGETRSVAAAHTALARRPDLLAHGPTPLLHFLLDVLVDNYLPIMDHVGEAIDALEESVFDPRGERIPEHAVHLKRGMAALRRIVGPERDTLLALTRDEFKPIPADMRPYLRDVYDRLARVSDLLDSYRDEIATLLELHVSVVSNRLNEIIKRLTVIATVGVPLTVVTSYYGMNLQIAAYKWPHGELYVLAVLAVTALLTYAVLRWKRWD